MRAATVDALPRAGITVPPLQRRKPGRVDVQHPAANQGERRDDVEWQNPAMPIADPPRD